jgi:hypothetical protein
MKLTTTVKGLRYRVTDETMRIMHDVTPLDARLERESDNPNDENAIKVVLCDKPWEDFHIGYLPRLVAEKFAPKLDDGSLEIRVATVTDVDHEQGEATIRLGGRQRKSLQKEGI